MQEKCVYLYCCYILGLVSKIRRYSSQANIIPQAQARALSPRQDPASEEGPASYSPRKMCRMNANIFNTDLTSLPFHA